MRKKDSSDFVESDLPTHVPGEQKKRSPISSGSDTERVATVVSAPYTQLSPVEVAFPSGDVPPGYVAFVGYADPAWIQQLRQTAALSRGGVVIVDQHASALNAPGILAPSLHGMGLHGAGAGVKPVVVDVHPFKFLRARDGRIVSGEEFVTERHLPDGEDGKTIKRPWGNGIQGYEPRRRWITQIQEDLGIRLLPPTREELARDPTGASIPLPPADAVQRVKQWVLAHPAVVKSPAGKVALSNHQKAIKAFLIGDGYWRAESDPFFEHTWDNEKDRKLAVRAKASRENNHFIRDVLEEVPRLYKGINRDGDEFEPKKPVKLATFCGIVHATVAVGGRESDMLALTGDCLDFGKKQINRWWISKQQDYRTSLLVPEDWFWHGSTGPSLEWYLRFVRPRLAPNPEAVEVPVDFHPRRRPLRQVVVREDWKPPVPVDAKVAKPWYYYLSDWSHPDLFLNPVDGKPWPSVDAFRNWVNKGLAFCLGYPIGLHSLRRLSMTLRYRFGTTRENMEVFYLDKWDSIEASYLDASFLSHYGILKAEVPFPPIPLIREGVKWPTLAEIQERRSGRR